MAEVKAPVVGNLEVTQDIYETVSVLVALEELKELGIISGGPDVDRDQLAAIELAGRGFGYAKPSAERVKEIMDGIMHRPQCRGGR